MAKKSFKKGLESLINDTRKTIKEDNKINISDKDKKNKELEDKIRTLTTKLRIQNDELKMWRTGKLTPQIFEESIKDFKLKYNAETNTFEEL